MLGPARGRARRSGAARADSRAARRGATQLPAPAQAGQLAARFRAHRSRPRPRLLRAGGSRGADRGPGEQFPLGHGTRRPRLRRRLPGARRSRCTSIARCGRRSSSTCCRTRSSSRSQGRVTLRLRATPATRVLEVMDTGIGVARAGVAAPVRAFPPRRRRAGTHPRGLRHRPRAGQELVKLHGGHDRGRKRAGARHDLPRSHPARHRAPARAAASSALRPAVTAISSQTLRAGSAALAAGWTGRRSRAAGHRGAGNRARRAISALPRPSARASCWPTTTPTCAATCASCSAAVYEIEAVGDGAGRAGGRAARSRRT